MPASTPIYGFTYPCQGETIDPSAFVTLANQIDAKLLDVEADRFLALNRYNSDLTSSATQTIPNGVDTVLTSPASTYTLPMAGVYIFDLRVITVTTPATINMLRGSVYQNGVFRFSMTRNTEGNSAMDPTPSGPIVGAAGDVITSRFFYDGLGTMDVQARMSVKMLVRIA
jgi:hypothetical protein